MSEDARVRDWQPLAFSIADRYRLPGAGIDDVRQEALIGLLSALRTFNGVGSLRSFVGMCVQRQVINALRTSQRQKHRVLSEAVRVVVVNSEEGAVTDAVELAPSLLGRDAYLVAVENESLRALGERARTLSVFERRAIGGVVSGYTYCEIEGVPEGVKPKWVDNAVQRARRKLAA